MKPIIKVENLSKQYRLGTIGTGTLRQDVSRWMHKIRGKEDPYLKIGETNDRSTKGESDYVWALKDIDFEVMPGEVLGIIGKNGAGKSTLLKILSKVTGPTTGRIDYNGRIGSLLEVGTGFHPELTGRENIFLNGAILGMTKYEIRSKLDEIIDFSGCERYIDTPVKRYSSGMTVRLGFAVAAHLEPEILIVDEVLAVGDAEFQKKAIGKMQDVSRYDGRTVLFVSHNMAAVQNLCDKSIVLKNGTISFTGNTTDAINFYQKSHTYPSLINVEQDLKSKVGNDKIEIIKFEIKPTNSNFIVISSGFEFELCFINKTVDRNLAITFELTNNEDIIIFHHGKWICNHQNSQIGIYCVRGFLPPNTLNAGLYKFKLIFAENVNTTLFLSGDIIQFEVLNEPHAGNMVTLPGVIRPDLQYVVSFLGQND
jgi:lipopolysaccharide transport system ATP-binding protein